MAAPEILETSFASWNVLHDGNHRIGEPQHVRLADLTQLLADHELNFDVAGLLEVHGTDDNHLGAEIAERLGLANYTFTVNGPSGMLMATSERFEKPEVLPLDPDHAGRKALITRGAGGLAVAEVHPSHHVLKGLRLRKRQTATLLDYLDNDERAIIMGDLNAMPWQSSRRMLEDHGFISVFDSLQIPHPSTYPADLESCDIGVPRIAQGLFKSIFRLTGGVSIDGMYVRGAHEVITADVIKPPEGRVLSDHHGIVTTIRWLDSKTKNPQQETPSQTQIAA